MACAEVWVPLTPGSPCTGQPEGQRELLLLSGSLETTSISIPAAVGLAGVSVLGGLASLAGAALLCCCAVPSLRAAEPCHSGELCQAVARLQPQPCQGCLSSQRPCWGSHSIHSPSPWLVERHGAGLGTCGELQREIERIFCCCFFLVIIGRMSQGQSSWEQLEE